MTDSAPAIFVVAANEASCDDLQTIFGMRGSGFGCRCQRYKLRPRESFGNFPVEDAYLGGEPAGWCAVEPRSAYEGLLRVYRVPWEGRSEDKSDDRVWAVTCFFTRAGFRKRGVSRALAQAAVNFARERGALAVEGYPITTKDVILQELHVGTERMFAAAGFREVSRPTARRLVMRVDF
jgi:GNAT superfamily N-acetyltransferase